MWHQLVDDHHCHCIVTDYCGRSVQDGQRKIKKNLWHHSKQEEEQEKKCGNRTKRRTDVPRAASRSRFWCANTTAECVAKYFAAVALGFADFPPSF